MGFLVLSINQLRLVAGQLHSASWVLYLTLWKLCFCFAETSFSSAETSFPAKGMLRFLYCCPHCPRFAVMYQKILGGHACCESTAYLLRFCYRQMVTELLVMVDSCVLLTRSILTIGALRVLGGTAVLWRLGFDWLLRKQRLS